MSDKIVLDMDDALELLIRAREERGWDYVDPGSADSLGCYNVKKVYEDEDGVKFDEPVLSPSCIAGTVLAYAGIDLELLYKYNGTVNSTVRAINEYDDGESYYVTPNAAAVLRVAQREQDNGKEWGVAVEAAYDIGNALRGEGD
jgi:hypothetical protein